ncbi:MAG: N-acetyltransferase family protein [Actinomycetota bacterium]
MTATIRFATAADIGELARLRWQLYTEQGPLGEPFEVYVERFTAFARDALGREEWRAWCAGDEGRLIAAMWLQTVPRIPAPGHGDPRPIGYLTNMYVEPDHRSQGLGSRMLQELIAHCEASGVELVLAFPAAGAYGFYERNGFGRPPAPVVHDLGR